MKLFINLIFTFAIVFIITGTNESAFSQELSSYFLRDDVLSVLRQNEKLMQLVSYHEKCLFVHRERPADLKSELYHIGRPGDVSRFIFREDKHYGYCYRDLIGDPFSDLEQKCIETYKDRLCTRNPEDYYPIYEQFLPGCEINTRSLSIFQEYGRCVKTEVEIFLKAEIKKAREKIEKAEEEREKARKEKEKANEIVQLGSLLTACTEEAKNTKGGDEKAVVRNKCIQQGLYKNLNNNTLFYNIVNLCAEKPLFCFKNQAVLLYESLVDDHTTN